MELQESFYYDHSKFPNVLYLINMAFEKFFSRELFRNNASRVFYSSEDYAFRRRLNLLAESGEPSIKAYDFPFMCYYRESNWQIDKDRPGVQNATAALIGFPEEELSSQKARFINAMCSFTCTAFFTSDKDAQLANEILLWIQQPAPKQFTYSGIRYLGYTIPIPVTFVIKDITFNPTYKEKDWLEKNKIIPIKFVVDIKSTLLAQNPQTPESTLFREEEIPVIAESALLDFFAYKTGEQVNVDHLDFEVTAAFDPDVELQPVLAVDSKTATSMVLTWSYNSLIDIAKYQENVLITLNGTKDFTAKMADKTFTIPDLIEGSVYKIDVFFTELTGKVAKASITATTESAVQTGLKGMIGYSF